MSDYKLKLSSKKLKSGKCQVKFELSEPAASSYYGYILSEGNTPLREVIQIIYKRVQRLHTGDSFHEHLFHLEKRNYPQQPLILFKN